MNTLKPGDKVPAFSVTDQDRNTYTEAFFRGRSTVVFFYPRANTPGCTLEACNLRDHYSELKAKGYTLLGVSADTERKQGNFARKFDLPFPLLADVDHQVIDAFGVWGSKKFMGRIFDGIHRKTFIVNSKGVVSRVIDKVKTKDHAAQVLEED